MSYAAMDLGSSSFHLLVAAPDPRGGLVKLSSYREVLALGRHLDAEGRLPAAVIGRALDALGTMVALSRSFRAHPIAVGTSALRNARNRAELVQRAADSLDLRVEILSGSEEAELVYRGARSALSGLPERTAVLDLGGGSLEIAVGEQDACLYTASLPLGFLRVPSKEPRAVRAHVLASARAVVKRVRALAPEAWVLSGGTARALATLAGPAYRVEGRPLFRTGLETLAHELAASRPARLEELGVKPERGETIATGALVLAAAVDALRAPWVHLSRGGLREGVVLREMERRRRALDGRLGRRAAAYSAGMALR